MSELYKYLGYTSSPGESNVSITNKINVGMANRLRCWTSNYHSEQGTVYEFISNVLVYRVALPINGSFSQNQDYMFDIYIPDLLYGASTYTTTGTSSNWFIFFNSFGFDMLGSYGTYFTIRGCHRNGSGAYVRLWISATRSQSYSNQTMYVDLLCIQKNRYTSNWSIN